MDVLECPQQRCGCEVEVKASREARAKHRRSPGQSAEHEEAANLETLRLG